MRTAFLAAAFLSLVGSGVSAERAPPPSPTVCKIRLLEGKPDGTAKELSTSLVPLTLPRYFENGDRFKASPGETLNFVAMSHVQLKRTAEKTCEANVNLDFKEPENKGGDVVSTAASSVRAKGTFTLGKPTKIVAKELGDGKQLWAEITFDKAP
jgi:hypothetical protein